MICGRKLQWARKLRRMRRKGKTATAWGVYVGRLGVLRGTR